MRGVGVAWWMSGLGVEMESRDGGTDKGRRFGGGGTSGGGRGGGWTPRCGDAGGGCWKVGE